MKDLLLALLHLAVMTAKSLAPGRASGDRGEPPTQAATDRPAPCSPAGAEPDAERLAALRIRVALPQSRTDPKGRRRRTLPESFASDPERLGRFQREAQVLASLNHPNIAHIHGLEESNGIRARDGARRSGGPGAADRARADSTRRGAADRQAHRQVVAISPDGTQIAYVANQRLYLRAMSDDVARPTSSWSKPFPRTPLPDGCCETGTASTTNRCVGGSPASASPRSCRVRSARGRIPTWSA